MERRAILHCDCNNFFASCECVSHPEIADKPVVVAGRVEDRHGVIIAKNYIAKKAGVKTGMRIYEARMLCRNLVVMEPNMSLYNYYSNRIKQIYVDFTDMVESFSIDECFLDVTHSKMFGTPEEIADKIRERVKKEIGITISVGVSFCKVFAKIGSDIKKPDATTVITYENFKQKVWSLDIENMIGVGQKTQDKFKKWGILTIKDLATFPLEHLERKLGKVGRDLWLYANGLDERPVAKYYEFEKPKSIGNSATFYRDLKTNSEVLMALEVIAESVVSRMIKGGLLSAETLHLVVKDNALNVSLKQCKLPYACRNSKVFAHTAYNIFNRMFEFKQNVRLLGISVSGFGNGDAQISMFETEKNDNLDETMLLLRNKFGAQAIGRCSALLDERISGALLKRTELLKEIQDI